MPDAPATARLTSLAAAILLLAAVLAAGCGSDTTSSPAATTPAPTTTPAPPPPVDPAVADVTCTTTPAPQVIVIRGTLTNRGRAGMVFLSSRITRASGEPRFVGPSVYWLEEGETRAVVTSVDLAGVRAAADPGCALTARPAPAGAPAAAYVEGQLVAYLDETACDGSARSQCPAAPTCTPASPMVYDCEARLEGPGARGMGAAAVHYRVVVDDQLRVTTRTLVG